MGTFLLFGLSAGITLAGGFLFSKHQKKRRLKTWRLEHYQLTQTAGQLQLDRLEPQELGFHLCHHHESLDPNHQIYLTGDKNFDQHYRLSGTQSAVLGAMTRSIRQTIINVDVSSINPQGRIICNTIGEKTQTALAELSQALVKTSLQDGLYQNLLDSTGQVLLKSAEVFCTLVSNQSEGNVWPYLDAAISALFESGEDQKTMTAGQIFMTLPQPEIRLKLLIAF